MRRVLIVAAAAIAHSPTTRRVALRVGAGAAGVAAAPAFAERTGLLNVDATGLSLPKAVELSLPRPPLPKAKRQPLDQAFAVCLMRSSYNTVDELDFVAMDQFQKQFFFRRQDEWDIYRSSALKQLGRAPMQGELTDPLYFDVISYTQYKTINDCLRAPSSVFEELIDSNGTTVVVARDASSVDDKLLASEHARRVGDKVLDFVLERFDNSSFTRVAVATDLSRDILEANANKLATLLAVLGFAIDASAVVRGSKLEVTFVAPANYWGLKALAAARPPLVNDFGAKCVGAWLSRCGYRRAPAATTFDAAATAYTHAFSLA